MIFCVSWDKETKNKPMNEEIYYTYAWLREDRTPYYIGKGKNRRAWRRGSPPRERVLILKKGLCEQDAFKHEVYMIFILGRKDKGTGILRNMTDGGDGCAEPSWETRIKIGGANRGRKLSEETRRKMSKAHTGKKRPYRGKETRRRMSEAQKGKKHTTESRKKIGEAFKRLAWFYDPVSKATKRCRPEDCPDGYRHGRGQKR